MRSNVEGQRARKRERRYQRRYARLHGYYWLPCVLCGTEHGGHEAGGSLPDNGSEERFTTICPWCTAERQERAEQHLRTLGLSCGTQVSRWGFDGVMAHRIGTRPSGKVQDSLIVYVGHG